MPKPEIPFTPSSTFPLTPHPGNADITEQILAFDPDTKNVTKIQTIAPGYVEPGNGHSHEYWEEIYVLDGTGYCGTQKKWLQPGDYACRPPGMHHGPFKCKPDEHFKYLIIDTFEWAGKKPPAPTA